MNVNVEKPIITVHHFLIIRKNAIINPSRPRNINSMKKMILSMYWWKRTMILKTLSLLMGHFLALKMLKRLFFVLSVLVTVPFFRCILSLASASLFTFHWPVPVPGPVTIVCTCVHCTVYSTAPYSVLYSIAN